jgi:hypothetical protein
MNLKLLLFSQLKQQSFIKNIEHPNCKDCIYFKEHPDPHNKYHLSKCTFFGEKDNISGNINYMYTKTCRNNDILCGKDGKYYKENIK